MTISFSTLLKKHTWRPIPNCPGRYVLADGPIAADIQTLTGSDLPVSEARYPGARDPVCTCRFAGGGLISYRQGTRYLHTLCDSAGFERKMTALKEAR